MEDWPYGVVSSSGSLSAGRSCVCRQVTGRGNRRVSREVNDIGARFADVGV